MMNYKQIKINYAVNKKLLLQTVSHIQLNKIIDILGRSSVLFKIEFEKIKMILLTLSQAFLLLAALAIAAPSFQHRINHNSKLHPITETIKSPYPTRNQNYSDEQADAALDGFVGRAMFNYSTWLAQEDPLRPDPTEVTLVTEGFDFKDMNAVMKIR